MKNNLILALFVLVAVCFGQQAKAQVSASTTPGVNLSIQLQDVISISLGASPDVAFVYDDAADYVGSKTISKTAHVTVVSNKTYNLSVIATAFTPVATPTALSLSAVTVSVDPTSTAQGSGTLSSVALSTTAGTLITSAVPSITAVYNIDYTITDATPLLNKAAATYNSTVTYTATQL